MKRFLFIQAILICIAIPTIAQKKIEKYCVFSVTPVKKDVARVNFAQGQVDSLFSFKDSSISANLANIPTVLKTEPDLLNYMALQGWTLSGYAVTAADGFSAKYLVFKKEFDLAELKNH